MSEKYSNYDFQLEVYAFNPDITATRGFNQGVKNAINEKKLSKKYSYPVKRIGVYKNPQGDIKYFDIDDKPYSKEKRYDDINQLYSTKAKKNRIYFMGHASGGGDGIKGDAVGSKYDESEIISNDVISEIINDFAQNVESKLPEDSLLHVSFASCNYDNKEQARKQQQTKTNLERCFDKIHPSPQISLKGSSMTDEKVIDSGKVSLSRGKKLVDNNWKSESGRHIMFFYEYPKGSFIPAKTEKMSLLSSKDAIVQKKEIMDLCVELLDALRIPEPQKGKYIKFIAVTPQIWDREALLGGIHITCESHQGYSEEKAKDSKFLHKLLEKINVADIGNYAKRKSSATEKVIAKIADATQTHTEDSATSQGDLLVLLLQNRVTLKSILSNPILNEHKDDLVSRIIKTLSSPSFSIRESNIKHIIFELVNNGVDQHYDAIPLIAIKTMSALETLDDLNIITDVHAKNILSISTKKPEIFRYIRKEFPQCINTVEDAQELLLIALEGNAEQSLMEDIYAMITEIGSANFDSEKCFAAATISDATDTVEFVYQHFDSSSINPMEHFRIALESNSQNTLEILLEKANLELLNPKSLLLQAIELKCDNKILETIIEKFSFQLSQTEKTKIIQELKRLAGDDADNLIDKLSKNVTLDVPKGKFTTTLKDLLSYLNPKRLFSKKVSVSATDSQQKMVTTPAIASTISEDDEESPQIIDEHKVKKILDKEDSTHTTSYNDTRDQDEPKELLDRNKPNPQTKGGN